MGEGRKKLESEWERWKVPCWGNGSIDIQAYNVRIFSGRAFVSLEHEQEWKVAGRVVVGPLGSLRRVKSPPLIVLVAVGRGRWFQLPL